jgi:hypothetical protein
LAAWRDVAAASASSTAAASAAPTSGAGCSTMRDEMPAPRGLHRRRRRSQSLRRRLNTGARHEHRAASPLPAVQGGRRRSFSRSRRPLVADQQRDRPCGDPVRADAENRERLSRRARVVSGSDKSQLPLGDREDVLRRRREQAAVVGSRPPTSGENHADASLGSKLATSANTTPRISPSHKPINPHVRSTS